MFMTALNVAIGRDVAAGLPLGSGSALTYGLHAAGFVLAAPATFAGVAFLVAVAVAAFRTDALPRWSGWWAAAAGLANVGALGGVLSRSGPSTRATGSSAASPSLSGRGWSGSPA